MDAYAPLTALSLSRESKTLSFSQTPEEPFFRGHRADVHDMIMLSASLCSGANLTVSNGGMNDTNLWLMCEVL